MTKKDINTKKILTIPNILSLLRIGLIPIFIKYYVFNQNYQRAGLVLIISGLTDMIDGYIARNFNQVSDLGKVLDPAADKLTQLSILFSLTFRYKDIILPLGLEFLKDILMVLVGAKLVKKTGHVPSASWHGKVATFSLYVLMISHVLWINVPPCPSKLLILTTSFLVGLSLVLYMKEAIDILKKS